jgi:CRISPR-associated protein Cmr3
LVGRSGSKFPPDAATLSGLFLSTNREKPFADHQKLKMHLTIAGGFWAKDEDFQHGNQDFYVPIPRSLIIDEHKTDQWEIQRGKWSRSKKDEDIEAAYHWQTISTWGKPIESIRKQGVSEVPWKFVPMLHPTLESAQRRVRMPKNDNDRGSLFLENAVQMKEDSFLVYLSTHEMPDGWYRFGGENHLVEITSQKIVGQHIIDLLDQKIERQFALICPAVWGTNNLSFRYPKDISFSNKRPKMLIDRPIPFRPRITKNTDDKQRTNNLGIGRYAVPAGTVYVLKHPLDEEYKTWSKFPDKWFPQHTDERPIDQRPLPLKHLGCGLCLPIKIKES